MRGLAVLLLSLLVARAQADELGRLFFTPDERARMDEERRAPPATPVEVATLPVATVVEPAPGPAATPAVPLTVNGIVLRAQGPSTAWINGTPGTRRDLATLGGRTLSIARDGVEIDDADARARVKPGQTFEPARRRVVEAFEPPSADGTPQ